MNLKDIRLETLRGKLTFKMCSVETPATAVHGGRVLKQIDDKTWATDCLTFKDLGKIEGGVTHRYEVLSKGDWEEHTNVLGWILWRPSWRRYVYRSIAFSVELDFLCLTTIAEFAKLRTDERKAEWKPQGKFGG
jgi:hypothetical protein